MGVGLRTTTRRRGYRPFRHHVAPMRSRNLQPDETADCLAEGGLVEPCLAVLTRA
jgi:hypothetical protein